MALLGENGLRFLQDDYKALPCLFIVYFFLHLFILQAIYIVLQDWRIKDAIVELNIRLQE